MRKRCSFNEKLKLHYGPDYNGVENQYSVVQYKNEPLIENYLEGLERVLLRVTRLNTRTLAIRVDLRYPQNMFYTDDMVYTNEALTRFFRYFKRELEQADTKYTTQLHYAWAREQNTRAKPHYHILLLLNADAFSTIGVMSASPGGYFDRDNLYHRLVRAWGRAIGWDLDQMVGLVHICNDPDSQRLLQVRMHRNDPTALQRVFKAGSYLCKQATKTFNQNLNTFNTSREQRG